MKPSDAVALLKTCDRIERLFKAAADEWEKHQSDTKLKTALVRPESMIRLLVDGVKIDYPGLSPAFRVGGRDCYSVSSALIESLPEKKKRVLSAWRSLRNFVKRGMTVSAIHAGDRGRVRLVVALKRETGELAIVDLTWYLSRAFVYRYSEKTRLLSVDATNIVDWLSWELFADRAALKVDWL